MSFRYFWKVIYDEKTKKGIAIVGVNNPHKTEPNLCTPVEEVSDPIVSNN